MRGVLLLHFKEPEVRGVPIFDSKEPKVCERCISLIPKTQKCEMGASFRFQGAKRVRDVPDFCDLPPLVYVGGALGTYDGFLMFLYEFTLRLEMLSLSRVTGVSCCTVTDVSGCFGRFFGAKQYTMT